MIEIDKIDTTVSHNDSVTISWKNISYEVDIPSPLPDEPPVKKILKDLTGSAISGRLLAIMGGSGCGKTSFLNCISGRVASDSTHRFEGEVFLNELKFTSKYKRTLSFVSQDDIVFENDTPREALYFNARVKTQLSEEEANARVVATLEQIGITHCADTPIGTPGLVRGISGGERKRTNIGAELITNPRILLLDEPTTGLDSVTALQVVKRLQTIAHEDNRTVMCTIHQPSSEIFDAFDDLMLLAHGRVIYHGTAKDAIPYFASHGHIIPPRHNPSDFYMKILQGDLDVADKLCDVWASSAHEGNESARLWVNTTSLVSTNLMQYAKSQGAGPAVQCQMLLRRSFRAFIRHPIAFKARMGQTLFMTFLIGFMWIRLDYGQSAVQDRVGFLFLTIVNTAMTSIFNGVIVFPPERAVFLREQANGAYNPYIYAFSKYAAELPMQLFFPAFTGTILYFMIGFRSDVGAFFIFLATLVLVANTAQSFGLFVAAAVSDVQTAMAIVPITVLPFMLTSGFLASSDRLDPGFLWLQYMSFIRYAFIMLAKNEFVSEVKFQCIPGEVCLYRDGSDVIKFLGFESETMWGQALILLAMLIFLRIVTALSLGYQAKKHRS